MTATSERLKCKSCGDFPHDATHIAYPLLKDGKHADWQWPLCRHHALFAVMSKWTVEDIVEPAPSELREVVARQVALFLARNDLEPTSDYTLSLYRDDALELTGLLLALPALSGCGEVVEAARLPVNHKSASGKQLITQSNLERLERAVSLLPKLSVTDRG